MGTWSHMLSTAELPSYDTNLAQVGGAVAKALQAYGHHVAGVRLHTSPWCLLARVLLRDGRAIHARYVFDSEMADTVDGEEILATLVGALEAEGVTPTLS